jgi:hypothetical protein
VSLSHDVLNLRKLPYGYGALDWAGADTSMIVIGSQTESPGESLKFTEGFFVTNETN